MNALLALAMLVAASGATFSPPAVVVARIDTLKPVATFGKLPEAIRTGDFTVDGHSAKGWMMSDPGGPFQATDTVEEGSKIPSRRMSFAGCNASLCVLAYERGGIAHFWQVLAFVPGKDGGYTVVWNAYGNKPFANMAALAALVKHPSTGAGWYDMSVAGNF